MQCWKQRRRAFFTFIASFAQDSIRLVGEEKDAERVYLVRVFLAFSQPEHIRVSTIIIALLISFKVGIYPRSFMISFETAIIFVDLVFVLVTNHESCC